MYGIKTFSLFRVTVVVYFKKILGVPSIIGWLKPIIIGCPCWVEKIVLKNLSVYLSILLLHNQGGPSFLNAIHIYARAMDTTYKCHKQYCMSFLPRFSVTRWLV